MRVSSKELFSTLKDWNGDNIFNKVISLFEGVPHRQLKAS